MIVSAVMILFVVIIVYCTLLLPERNRQKRQSMMIHSIGIGSVVYTVDGIRGKVDAVSDGGYVIRCFPDEVLISFGAESIASLEGFDEKKAKKQLAKQRKKRF
ncbi:MAG: preprotein translocase subunit YajC [Eubacteriales bacterium]|nr:preprotein translocase subunit YajC [Eubacteriales bacterium]